MLGCHSLAVKENNRQRISYGHWWLLLLKSVSPRLLICTWNETMQKMESRS